MANYAYYISCIIQDLTDMTQVQLLQMYYSQRGFKECSFIQTTGKQWINTGITSFQLGSTAPKLIVQFMKLDGADLDYFGTQSTPNSDYILYNTATGSQYIRWLAKSAQSTSWNWNSLPVALHQLNVKHKYQFFGYGNSTLTIDNQTTYNGTTTTSSLDKNFPILIGRGRTMAKAKYYSFKMFNGDQMLIDLIPAMCMNGSPYIDGNTGQQVVTLSDKPGMYDKITGKFFVNQGTEQFTYELKS